MHNAPMSFAIGTRVYWVRAVPADRLNSEGVILAIVAGDRIESFTEYEVAFAFGRVTLYGTQIDPVARPVEAPARRILLQIVLQEAKIEYSEAVAAIQVATDR